MLKTSHILEMAKRLREMRMPPKIEPPVDRLVEKAAEEGTDELVKKYKKDTPGQSEEVKEATTGDQEEYQKKRRAVAKKFGVTSCSQLDDPEKKKACYAALDAAHVSDDEEDEDDDPVGKNEEIEIEEAWQAGVVYHQEFNNGDRVYFRADSLQKNKRWKGVSVDEFGGKQKKARNNTADEKLPNWKTTPTNEIPKVMKEGVEIEEAVAGWIAIYNREKLEIKKDKANGIYGAKQIAIKHFKIPKSKESKLSIGPAHEEVEFNESPMLQAKMALRDAGLKHKEHNGKLIVNKKDKKKVQDALIKSFARKGTPPELTIASGSFQEGVELDEVHMVRTQKVKDGYKWLVQKVEHNKTEIVDTGVEASRVKANIAGKKARSKITEHCGSCGEGEGIEEAKRKSKKDYEIYHKTYSGAVQHAADVAKKQGYEVDQDSWDSEITHGQRKPSEGKTVIKKIKLTKDGKPQRKMLQIQVHGMKTQYELNMYIESVGNPYSMVRRLKWGLNEGEKGVTNIKTGYLTHVKEFLPELQAGIKKVIPGVKLVLHSINPRSESGKTIPGLGLVLSGYDEPTIMIQWDERIGSNPSRVPAIARGKWKSPEGDEGDDAGYDPKTHRTHTFTIWINEAASAKGSTEKGRVDWYPRQYYNEYKRVVQYLKTKVKRGVTRKEEVDIGEKIDLARSKMGDVVKDFQDSDAPQFRGKSDKKRKEMAIAAKLDADRKEEYGQEDKPKSKKKDKINLKPKMDETMKTLKDIRNSQVKMDEIRWDLMNKDRIGKKVNFDDVVVKIPSRDGKSTFVVVPRDTKGMRGKQDPYSMLELDKSGKIVKDYGSHPSLAGATKFVKARASNREASEEVEVGEARKPARDVGLECQECGKKFRSKNPKYGTTKCPKCKSTDIDLDYSGKEEVETREPNVNEAVTALGVEYEESDFDGPHRLDAAYPNLNVNFAKYMEEDLEGPYDVGGEVYFYDRKVSMFYSVSGEDYVDEETGKELVYRLHKNGMYKIELGR